MTHGQRLELRGASVGTMDGLRPRRSSSNNRWTIAVHLKRKSDFVGVLSGPFRCRLRRLLVLASANGFLIFVIPGSRALEALLLAEAVSESCNESTRYGLTPDPSYLSSVHGPSSARPPELPRRHHWRLPVTLPSFSGSAEARKPSLASPASAERSS